MKARSMTRRLIAFLLCTMMICAYTPCVLAESEGNAAMPEDGTFAPGEVIVMFREGAVKDTDTSLRSAKKLYNVDQSFGDAMAATGEISEAAQDAKSEVSIIKSSLGDNFIIKDSIAFDDDLVIALIFSDTYDTETMIEKLSRNKNVVSAEPNYVVEPQSYGYSLNDEMNAYNYQANTSLAQNDAGKNTNKRGSDVQASLSTNAGSITFTDEEKANEVVVAVMDSGILADHEDLQGMLWTNPGDIGLEGEHGYNFYHNNTDITDQRSHGTHVSGIIAANANNGKGIAGTACAAGANVKIMMVSTGETGVEDYEVQSAYRELGAFNYILKAKQRGVNIVASSNSWTSPDPSSTIYDDIINKLGEEGIVTFVAAGNYWSDLDNHSTSPPGSGDSPYMVVVGAAGVSGRPAGFSNYGKSKVDVFAPGLNILSSVSYSCYFPNIYSTEKRIATTEYYGEFNNNMVISDDKQQVTPSTGDAGDNVSAFGPSVFHAQDASTGDEVDTKATYELSKATDRTFTDSEDPASLKLTIHNPGYGEEYFFYFPYDKNPDTTGLDNTKFSIYAMNGFEEGATGYSLFGGEVQIDENGRCELTGYGNGPQDSISEINYDVDAHICENKSGANNNKIIGYDELIESGKSVGIGISLTPSGMGEAENNGDISIYLDSIAISRPDAEISAESSYDIMSGTSMATPACAGAYAAYAVRNPRREGQTGSEYALQNRAGFLSCVTRTDALKDLCATGGYIDMTHINETNPVITDAVSDLNKGTLTLYGENLNDDYTLGYKKLEDKNAEEVTLPSGGMDVSFAENGKSIVINNARGLFGTYVEFNLYDHDSLRATNSFFLVKGQKDLKVVYREKFINSDDIRDRKLITDTDGRKLYGYEPDTGVIYRYDGAQFSTIRNTNLKEAVILYMMKEYGYDEYDRMYNLNAELKWIKNPICTENKLYHFVDVTYEQGSDTQEERSKPYHFMASIDYTADKPAWTFTEITDLQERFGTDNIKYAALSGKIYCMFHDPNGPDTAAASMVYSYDTASNEWSREEDMPAYLDKSIITNNGDKLYVMLGGGFIDDSGNARLSRKVYCFDGTSWTVLPDIPFTGKFNDEKDELNTFAEGTCAAVKNGFIFFSTADGYGNVFLYKTDSGECEPLFYTLNEFKTDVWTYSSAVETRDGIYLIHEYSETSDNSFVMHLIPRSSGDYEPSYEEDPSPSPSPSPAPAPGEKAKLSKTSLSLKAGKTAALKVTNGNVVSWTSDNTKVVRVSKGKVKALRKGSAAVYAHLKDGTYLKCKVKVTTLPKLSKKSIRIKKGKTKTITITGKAPGIKNVYTKTGKAKIISKRNAKKIKVKGLKKGKTTLKITVNGVQLKLKVRVY